MANDLREFGPQARLVRAESDSRRQQASPYCRGAWLGGMAKLVSAFPRCGALKAIVLFSPGRRPGRLLRIAMPDLDEFLLGEFRRSLDERFRLSIPGELGAVLAAASPDCILAKERPGLLEPVERRGLAGSVGRGGRIGQAEDAGRQAAGANRRGAALRPPSFDPPPAGSIGRPRAAGDSRGFSGILGGRARRGSADRGGGGLRRDLESRGVAEVSRSPHASLPTAFRSAIGVEGFSGADIPVCRARCIFPGRQECLPHRGEECGVCPKSRASVSTPGLVEFPTSVPRRCHPAGAASHPGWVFFGLHDAPAPFPRTGRGFCFFGWRNRRLR